MLGRWQPRAGHLAARASARRCLVAMGACAIAGFFGCARDDSPSSTGAATGGGDETTTSSEGGGGAFSSTSASAGGGKSDLGWPFDDSLPEPCPAAPPDSGVPWEGWGNFQHPPLVTLSLGAATPALYGRAYHPVDTPPPGQAPGWQCELGAGPLGGVPDGEGRCWSFSPASYHLDVGNDDEWLASFTPSSPGLFALAFRCRPPGGAWRHGDLDGSDNGVSAETLAILSVAEPAGKAPLVVATLNLRCRLDDWPARRPLVVAALARIKPDFVAFQEDCQEDGGPSQAAEIAAKLGERTGRGYETRRVSTHLAGGVFDEGISLLSAHRVEASHTLELSWVHFPRKALAVDATVRGAKIRFYTTHFDYGAAAASARVASMATLLADLPSNHAAVVAGDFNATPDSEAMTSAFPLLRDGWLAANPSEPGLTMPAHAPERRIDYVLLAEPAPEVSGAKLLDEHDGVYLSDHLGVAVALVFP